MPESGQRPDRRKVLTSIRAGIHCAATDERGSDREHRQELDEIEINNFINILVDMIRSALTWEDAHGSRLEASQPTTPGLTGKARRINCPPQSSCLPLKAEGKEKGDDNEEAESLQASPVDL